MAARPGPRTAWEAAWLAAAVALASGCSPVPPQSSEAGRPALAASQPAAALPARMLVSHNRYRAAAGVALLEWDPLLAGQAEAYARQLAPSGNLVHSPREARPGQGENLWMGTAGAYAPETMVGNWASEREYFRSGVFPDVSTTGNWADVAHYTQMIWPDTASVGCGIARSGRWDVLVCRYAPAGNVTGQRVP